jgi:hypothetical protein
MMNLLCVVVCRAVRRYRSWHRAFIQGLGAGVFCSVNSREICGYRKPKNIFEKPLDKRIGMVYDNHVISC